MHELIREHFGPSFGIEGFSDAAILDVDSRKLAFTTDSYVVSPLFFPGGNIGDLAVYGTVNDLSVSGAEPLFLSAGFIIEEGFSIERLKDIVLSMARAAKEAGVKIVAGDTKVVNKGKGDGVFINTAGIGVLHEGMEISPLRIRKGDKVLINSEIGNHGIAVISERNGICFDPPVVSDTRPLNGIVRSIREFGEDVHFMRDPTRGGLATTLKEAALESRKNIRIRETSLPIAPQVKGACDLLGLDPLYVANEGALVAFVSPGSAEAIVNSMRGHAHGTETRIIGEVEDSAESMVLLQTRIGGNRIIEMLQGEQLPRIC